jgi:hypothetical protein
LAPPSADSQTPVGLAAKSAVDTVKPITQPRSKRFIAIPVRDLSARYSYLGQSPGIAIVPESVLIQRRFRSV